MAVFQFCIHRADTRDEKAVALTDVADILHLAIETRFREAGIVTRSGDAVRVAREAIDEALASLDELARDRTLRL